MSRFVISMQIRGWKEWERETAHHEEHMNGILLDYQDLLFALFPW